MKGSDGVTWGGGLIIDNRLKSTACGSNWQGWQNFKEKKAATPKI